MAMKREELHRIIDQLPENKLPTITDLLSKIYDEEDEELFPEELEEIKAAEQRISDGEYVTLDKLLEETEDKDE